MIDTRNKFIYTICYKDRNWRTPEGGNCLLVSRLRLPDVSEGDVSVDMIDQFELPFRVATQGAFFCDGLIVHGFGINTGENDGIVIIDPSKKRVVREFDTHDILKDEIEGVTPYKGAVLITLQHGKAYRMEL